jgi:hypothetical protein
LSDEGAPPVVAVGPPPERSRLALVTFAFAIAGAALTFGIGTLVIASIWSAQSGIVEARILSWAVLHGVLVGAAGPITGVLACIVPRALASKLTSPAGAAALGALLGAGVGSALGATVWDQAAGEPVAVGALVAHVLAGALLAVIATGRARRAS